MSASMSTFWIDFLNLYQILAPCSTRMTHEYPEIDGEFTADLIADCLFFPPSLEKFVVC